MARKNAAVASAPSTASTAPPARTPKTPPFLRLYHQVWETVVQKLDPSETRLFLVLCQICQDRWDNSPGPKRVDVEASYLRKKLRWRRSMLCGRLAQLRAIGLIGQRQISKGTYRFSLAPDEQMPAVEEALVARLTQRKQPASNDAVPEGDEAFEGLTSPSPRRRRAVNQGGASSKARSSSGSRGTVGSMPGAHGGVGGAGGGEPPVPPQRPLWPHLVPSVPDEQLGFDELDDNFNFGAPPRSVAGSPLAFAREALLVAEKGLVADLASDWLDWSQLATTPAPAIQVASPLPVIPALSVPEPTTRRGRLPRAVRTAMAHTRLPSVDLLGTVRTPPLAVVVPVVAPVIADVPRIAVEAAAAPAPAPVTPAVRAVVPVAAPAPVAAEERYLAVNETEAVALAELAYQIMHDLAPEQTPSSAMAVFDNAASLLRLAPFAACEAYLRERLPLMIKKPSCRSPIGYVCTESVAKPLLKRSRGEAVASERETGRGTTLTDEEREALDKRLLPLTRDVPNMRDSLARELLAPLFAHGSAEAIRPVLKAHITNALSRGSAINKPLSAYWLNETGFVEAIKRNQRNLDRMRATSASVAPQTTTPVAAPVSAPVTAPVVAAPAPVLAPSVPVAASEPVAEPVTAAPVEDFEAGVMWLPPTVFGVTRVGTKAYKGWLYRYSSYREGWMRIGAEVPVAPLPAQHGLDEGASNASGNRAPLDPAALPTDADAARDAFLAAMKGFGRPPAPPVHRTEVEAPVAPPQPVRREVDLVERPWMAPHLTFPERSALQQEALKKMLEGEKKPLDSTETVEETGP